jgi:hypothetical protein
LPEGYISARPYPGTTYRLKDAAEANQLIVVRCVHCRRMVRYLASDLLALLGDPRRDAYAPPFACSHCKTADYLKVQMHSPMPGDYGALTVRRPGPVRHTQTWRTVKLGD